MPWTSWKFMNFATGMWVDAIMDSMPRVVTFKAMCVMQVTNLIDPSYVDLNGLDRFNSIVFSWLFTPILAVVNLDLPLTIKNYPKVF